LHAIVDSSGAIDAFSVTALNAGEAPVLRKLADGVSLCGVILRTDSNYDSNPTYTTIAQAKGKLVAPRRKPGTALGHHWQHPDRVAAIAELEESPARLASHKRQRNRVEQVFAHLTNLSFGLSPLPNFVRRLRRVSLWITAKITLYHLHQVLSSQAAAAA